MNIQTVIDVGCATYDQEDSILFLVDEFRPRFLIGFDPAADNDLWRQDDTAVMTFKAAAWTRNGQVPYLGSGSRARVVDDPDLPDEPTRCFDLARIVEAFAPAVLKIDAEGAEYTLLRHLIDTGADKLLQLAWVEWHGDRGDEREALEREFACEVRSWHR